jgi:hypothetical protein
LPLRCFRMNIIPSSLSSSRTPDFCFGEAGGVWRLVEDGPGSEARSARGVAAGKGGSSIVAVAGVMVGVGSWSATVGSQFDFSLILLPVVFAAAKPFLSPSPAFSLASIATSASRIGAAPMSIVDERNLFLCALSPAFFSLTAFEDVDFLRLGFVFGRGAGPSAWASDSDDEELVLLYRARSSAQALRLSSACSK